MPRNEPPAMVASKEKSYMNSTIPKRIIQVWGGGSEPPLLCKAAAANVRLLNPEFEYLLFDDDRMKAFINEQCLEYRGVFNSFRVPIQRFDFFRYLAIYRLGGFYFDMDVLLASNLRELLDLGCVFPFERLTWSDYLREKYGMDWEIGNYAFAASAGHPFLRAIIDNCTKAQNDAEWREAITNSLPRMLRHRLSVIYTTGPGLVSRTLAEYADAANEVNVLFPENVCDKNSWNLFGKYGVHLMHSSWRKQQGFVRRRLINLLERRNEKRAIRLARRLGGIRNLKP
jgi:inositol phosphorylceramide mannosyltransferase catalytic subunit